VCGRSGCPYATYSRFYDYYGDFDYADKWVSAALAGESMSFSSGKHGPNDFSVLGDAARVEAVKKGTAYMNVWMYVIREFEDAIDDCTHCESECNEFSVNSGSVHAWDEGVAFYTGSLEGSADGGGDGGKLVYRLAEKRCANFGTCGVSGDATSGTAKVKNMELRRSPSPPPSPPPSPSPSTRTLTPTLTLTRTPTLTLTLTLTSPSGEPGPVPAVR